MQKLLCFEINSEFMSEELKAEVMDWCRRMEIPLAGVANVERWESPPFQPWMPEDFYPQSIFPEAKSVIVIGLPVALPVLETSPSIFYRELYNTVNSLLDQHTCRLAGLLSEKGHASIFVPRDGYAGIKALQKSPVAFFSHRHAAFLAGLGSFGINNMLLTTRYGPRVRFGSVFTSARLPADPLLSRICAPGACAASICARRGPWTERTILRGSATRRDAQSTVPSSPDMASPPAAFASRSARWEWTESSLTAGMLPSTATRRGFPGGRGPGSM